MNVARTLMFALSLGLGFSGFVGWLRQSSASTAGTAEIKLPSDMQTERFDLWTKSDGVTAFDDLEIKSYNSK